MTYAKSRIYFNHFNTFNNVGTDFFDFVERWATIYKPMQHESGERSKNKRFYLTDTYMGMADFMTQIQPQRSPCVVMESNQDGMLGDGIDHPNYALYFMVRAERMTDGRAAMLAKLEAKMHLQKFVAYVRQKQRDEDPLLSRISIDDNLPYQTVGPMYNGWYGVLLQLTDAQRYANCVNEGDYVSEEDTTE